MRLIDAIDSFIRLCTSFGRRCWLAWRYVRAMNYGPRVAWAKARRAS